MSKCRRCHYLREQNNSMVDSARGCRVELVLTGRGMEMGGIGIRLLGSILLGDCGLQNIQLCLPTV